MARFFVAHAARADIHRIVDYLETSASKAVALRFALAFDAVFDRIADIPGVGSPRAEFGPNVRLSIVDPYLVFYDYDLTNDTVMVLRVLHGHRNITADMLRRS